MAIQDDDVVSLREFRNEIARIHGIESITSEIMDQFVTYRLRKYNKSGKERFGDLVMQFGEMKLNKIAFERK